MLKISKVKINNMLIILVFLFELYLLNVTYTHKSVYFLILFSYILTIVVYYCYKMLFLHILVKELPLLYHLILFDQFLIPKIKKNNYTIFQM